MSIDTRSIRAEPHPEIGVLIQQNAGLLVERWCRRAVDELPSATRVHYETLRDQLPGFLQGIGRSLTQTGDAAPGQHYKLALEHGEQRWDSGWSLSAVVRDYQLLQLVLLEYLEENLERPLQYREVMAVGVFINDAIAASIGAYVRSRDEHASRIDRERAEALETANRRKDEFLAMLAHELRNPLAPIVNSVKLLQMLLPTADPAILQTIDIIESQTEQITHLVDDLLDLARIAQGRIELRTKQVNLTNVLEQAIQECESDLKAREHQLTVTPPAEPLYLEADPTRLVQVVVNLLNNAAKFTDRGGQIWLTAKREDNGAVITVRDNGIGIPPEMLSCVFDMFVQVDGPRRRTEAGLGIGLTLVHRLVQLHGGTITCDSAGVGQGTEFTIRLPATARLRPAAEDACQKPQVVKPCHILIVEDHGATLDSLARLLKIGGHRIEVAENGAQGIERALESQPQVALIDIGLPDMDGYEVARKLRAALGDRIFLVALTGYGQAEDLRKALEAGFDAHLIKPTDFNELARLLDRAASGRR
jgi:signal transduction histidine kinase/ActR/RegA family two-component response regulator